MKSFSPKRLAQALSLEHRANEVGESSVHSLSDTVLLRRIRNGGLVNNTVSIKVSTKVIRQVFSTIVRTKLLDKASGLVLSAFRSESLKVRFSMSLSEPVKLGKAIEGLRLFLHGIHDGPSREVISEGDEIT